jgi:hypothetical protein
LAGGCCCGGRLGVGRGQALAAPGDVVTTAEKYEVGKRCPPPPATTEEKDDVAGDVEKRGAAAGGGDEARTCRRRSRTRPSAPWQGRRGRRRRHLEGV